MAKPKEYTRLEVYNLTMGWVVMADNTTVKDGKLTTVGGEKGAVWTYTHPEMGTVTTYVDLEKFGAYALF